MFEIFNYRTCAIISRGLYIFNPIFKDHSFVFKEVFSGLYSRAACNQERLMMARVRYTLSVDMACLLGIQNEIQAVWSVDLQISKNKHTYVLELVVVEK